ncbi:MAG: MarR family transcriptional regulator [Alcaligenaceae bacterium]|nr:MAG: MarR family transcriptional regulator [Alcaligenaceae bacterium]
MSNDLSDCLILNTMVTARTLLRHYDTKLHAFGITAAQFALLCAIRSYPKEPVATLANRVSLDRTSLVRNLNVLERKRLVQRAPGAIGNVRFCELTKQADALLDELLPQWQGYMTDLMRVITPHDAETYLAVSRHLTSRHS